MTQKFDPIRSGAGIPRTWKVGGYFATLWCFYCIFWFLWGYFHLTCNYLIQTTLIMKRYREAKM